MIMKPRQEPLDRTNRFTIEFCLVMFHPFLGDKFLSISYGNPKADCRGPREGWQESVPIIDCTLTEHWSDETIRG